MKKSTNNRIDGNRILKFKIARGDRFHNPGYLYYKGEERIDEGGLFNELFLSEHDSEEENPEYFDQSGSYVGLTKKDAESGIGRIDIDGDYNTEYTMYLKDVDPVEENTEFTAIIRSGSEDMVRDILLYNGFLTENQIKQIWDNKII